ncbi:hypothetical protein BCR34DRAFT_29882 [Clohesyomyces aquaticus]|uniref:Uncharacterized protein n=1 Tax=Clohesyomyces aquaticus TaxID=1231657 RepID=A0A1Y1ZAL0_9PLEO|nr:hypothetical protein BCR34DRAFT_29882 [Clohesyomyces aquaticus]
MCYRVCSVPPPRQTPHPSIRSSPSRILSKQRATPLQPKQKENSEDTVFVYPGGRGCEPRAPPTPKKSKSIGYLSRFRGLAEGGVQRPCPFQSSPCCLNAYTPIIIAKSKNTRIPGKKRKTTVQEEGKLKPNEGWYNAPKPPVPGRKRSGDSMRGNRTERKQGCKVTDSRPMRENSFAVLCSASNLARKARRFVPGGNGA